MNDHVSQIGRTLEGKRIVVTGASGYIASSLVETLSRIPCTLIRISRQRAFASFPHGLAQHIDIISDIRQYSTWETMGKVDVIFHLAGQTSARAANADPVEDFRNNVLPVLLLGQTASRQRYCPIVVFTSTVTVVGIPKKLLVDEMHPEQPVTIYDIHKLTAEKYLTCFTRMGILKAVSLRFPNIYGPGPPSSSSDRGVLNAIIATAVDGKPIRVFGTGSYLRDFLFISDASDALVTATCMIQKIYGEQFVIGSGVGTTFLQAAELVSRRIQALLKLSVEIRHQESTPLLNIDRRNFVADAGRFHQATGWQTKVKLQDGIDRTIRFFSKKKHEG